MLSETYLTMDAKRRISIPTKYRKEIGRAVAITRGIDGCLEVYPEKVWKERKTKVQQLAQRLSINRKHRQLHRFLTAGEYVDVDTSGRVVIPEHFTEFAGLTDAVVFVGTEDGFQLWNAGVWKTEGVLSAEEIQDLAESDEFQNLIDA